MEKYKDSLPRFAEVIIIGGGPAGAATALTLAARGVFCLVVEAAVGKNKVGEVIAPNFKPLLRKLGIEQLIAKSVCHFPAYGDRCIWGNEQPFDRLFITQTNNQGWHLDRVDFEQKLSQLAVRRGATWLERCQFLAAKSNNTGWQVSLQYRGKKRLVKTKFLVDATGRTSKLSRSLGAIGKDYDRLIGLACYFTLPRTANPHLTHIEAVARGWWYAAPLSGGRLVTVLMTDADLCDRSWQQPEGYWQQIQATKLIKTLLTERLPIIDSDITIKSARTSRLDSPIGDNWLAVGDAAFAYDHISSYGIGSALAGGFYGGHAIADTMAGKREALLAYRMITEQAFERYLPLLHQQYLQERRWRYSPFWGRRHNENFYCQL